MRGRKGFVVLPQVLLDPLCGALDPLCYLGIGGTAFWRVVFEAAVFRWVMRGGDDDPVGETTLAILVIGQDRVRNDGRRRVSIALIDHRIDVIGGKHLEGACQGGFGQRVCVDSDEQRAAYAASAPVEAIAWLIAWICASLKALSKADPRWPDVPNATRCDGIVGSAFR